MCSYGTFSHRPAGDCLQYHRHIMLNAARRLPGAFPRAHPPPLSRPDRHPAAARHTFSAVYFTPIFRWGFHMIYLVAGQPHSLRCCGSAPAKARKPGEAGAHPRTRTAASRKTAGRPPGRSFPLPPEMLLRRTPDKPRYNSPLSAILNRQKRDNTEKGTPTSFLKYNRFLCGVVPK